MQPRPRPLGVLGAWGAGASGGVSVGADGAAQSRGLGAVGGPEQALSKGRKWRTSKGFKRVNKCNISLYLIYSFALKLKKIYINSVFHFGLNCT